MPRIYGVQAAGSNFMAEAWQAGHGQDVLRKPPIVARTRLPTASAPACRATASKPWPRWWTPAGPSSRSATTRFWPRSRRWRVAAASSLSRPARPATPVWSRRSSRAWSVADDRIVVINTGSGLKDVKSAMTAVEQAGTRSYHVEPNLADLRRVMAEYSYRIRPRNSTTNMETNVGMSLRRRMWNSCRMIHVDRFRYSLSQFAVIPSYPTNRGGIP